MKKLRKTTLDELAKRMPILSENEQRSSIGGAWYYDASGNYLGELNEGYNQILIADPYTFERAVEEDKSPQTFDLDTISYVARDLIIEHIGKKFGLDLQGKDLENPGRNGVFNSSGIFVNNNSDVFLRGNIYDVFLIGIHEKNHEDTQGNAGTHESEAEAYEAMITHPDFQYASKEYQNYIFKQYNYHMNNSGSLNK